MNTSPIKEKKTDKTIEVLSFQKEYTILTKNLRDKHQMEYELGIIYVRGAELESGYKMIKMNKPTSSGLKATYGPIKNVSEFEKEVELIIKEINKFKEKFKEQDLDITVLKECTEKVENKIKN